MFVYFMIAPVLILTGVYAAIGTYSLVSYYRITHIRSNHILWFIAACYLSVLHNIARIGMYFTMCHSQTSDLPYFWVRTTLVIIPLLGISIVGFLNHYSQENRQIVKSIMFIFGILTILAIFGGEHVYDKSTATIGQFSFLGATVSRFRFWPGWIAVAIYGFLFISIGYSLFHFKVWGIKGDTMETRLLLLAGIGLAVTSASDVAIASKLITFIFIGEYGFFFLMIAICYSIINQISGSSEKKNQPVTTEKRNGDELFRGIDTEHIKKRLLALMDEEKLYKHENISLDIVASRLSLSTFRFSQFMNLEMNIDFRNFINSYRVEEAKKLLESQPHLSVKYICYEVGFQASSTFHSAFKKNTGTSPAKFRKCSSA